MATEKRVRRTPINGVRNILTVKGKEPGFEYRIVNDTGDRVAMFEERGYEIVPSDSITVGDRRVAKASALGSPTEVSVGNGTKGFLMRIKKEWYDEDQAAKEAQIKEQEKAMKADASQGMYGSLKITKD